MKKIGVGVEGPSDMRFWKGVLHRFFAAPDPVLFDVHNMSNRPRLIRDSERFLDMFHGAGYVAGVLILDLDENPCVEDLLSLFSDRVQAELKKPLKERFLHLAVAVRKLESWYLADPDAVRSVLRKSEYMGADYDVRWGKAKLGEVCGGVGRSYNELLFAGQISPHFSPERAAERSPSLRVAWERITHAASLGS